MKAEVSPKNLFIPEGLWLTFTFANSLSSIPAETSLWLMQFALCWGCYSLQQGGQAAKCRSHFIYRPQSTHMECITWRTSWRHKSHPQYKFSRFLWSRVFNDWSTLAVPASALWFQQLVNSIARFLWSRWSSFCVTVCFAHIYFIVTCSLLLLV